MSKSDWLHSVAIRACLIAAILSIPIGLTAQPQQPNRTQAEAAADNKNSGHDSLAPEFLSALRRSFDPWLSPVSCGYCDEAPEYRKEHRDNEDLKAQVAMADYAWGIMILTAVQSLAGFIGLYLIGRTLSETKKTANAGIDAAKAAKDQSETIRKEFHATHRPRLIMRQALSVITDPLKHKIVVHYTITNIGESECWITKAHIGIQVVLEHGYPIVRPPITLDFHDSVPHIGRINPGQTVECIYVDPTHGWEISYRDIGPEPLGIFFAGHLEYLDAPGSGISRHLGFRRRYDIDTGRFVRLKENNPDDEYAD